VSRLESDGEWLSAVSVDDLGRYCDALWHLNVVPERLPSYAAWSEHKSVSNLASEAVNSTGEGSSSSGSAWVWRDRFTEKFEVNRPLSTARPALVLGREMRFKSEIKFLVWKMKGDYLETTTTVVGRFSLESLTVTHIFPV